MAFQIRIPGHTSGVVDGLVKAGHIGSGLVAHGTSIPSVPGLIHEIDKVAAHGKIGAIVDEVVKALSDGHLTPFEILAIGRAVINAVAGSKKAEGHQEAHEAHEGHAAPSFDFQGLPGLIEGAAESAESVFGHSEAIETVHEVVEASEVVVAAIDPVHDALAGIEAQVAQMLHGESLAEAVSSVGEIAHDAMDIVKELQAPVAEAAEAGEAIAEELGLGDADTAVPDDAEGEVDADAEGSSSSSEDAPTPVPEVAAKKNRRNKKVK